MNPIFRDLRQFLHIVALMSEVLPPNLQVYTPSFVFTGRFYKVFGRYLLCCVRIALDRIQLLGHQLDWTGLGSVTRGFGLDWIASTQSISYSGGKHVVNPRPTGGGAISSPPLVFLRYLLNRCRYHRQTCSTLSPNIFTLCVKILKSRVS